MIGSRLACGEGAAALVPRPHGGEAVGRGRPANCGWVGTGDAAGAAGSDGDATGSIVDFYNGSRQIGPTIARRSPPTAHGSERISVLLPHPQGPSRPVTVPHTAGEPRGGPNRKGGQTPLRVG